MDTSTIVNIILCILSFALAAISVVTVVITIRQNHIMIENSTRPYIAMYSASSDIQSVHYYLCIKNFGQTGALINSFSCDSDLKQYSYDEEYVPFEHIPNTFISPGQSFVYNVDPKKLFKNPHPLTFTVEYSANNKKYSDTFSINVEADSDILHLRASTKGKELEIISYALQDISEKLL